MKIAAVTTFNRAGLDLYGRRMIATFLDNWPGDVPLTVYTEGWGPRDCPIMGYAFRDLMQMSPWLADFKERHKDKPTGHFRKDAVRFAHKVAALTHAASVFTGDVLIWLDGDIVTHSPVPRKVLEELAPKGDEWIAWLDREGLYPECGWYALNCRHPEHGAMVSAFAAMYADGHLFALPEWHDSYVLEHVVKTAGIAAKSLSGDGRKTSHPLVNSPVLSRYFDHTKGPRKLTGRTPAKERKIRDGHGYWA